VTEWIGAAIFAVGAIFAAGKFMSTIRAELSQVRSDMNGIGRKVRDTQKQNHKIALVILASTDDREERFRLVDLLKED
jgi:hypothetical protein